MLQLEAWQLHHRLGRTDRSIIRCLIYGLVRVSRASPVLYTLVCDAHAHAHAHAHADADADADAHADAGHSFVFSDIVIGCLS